MCFLLALLLLLSFRPFLFSDWVPFFLNINVMSSHTLFVAFFYHRLLLLLLFLFCLLLYFENVRFYHDLLT